MVILTLNCGSSSAKYQVYDWDNKEVMANGVVERIGIEGSCITHKAKGKKTEIESPCPTHKEAIELIIKEITDSEVGVIKSMDEIGAVGHRVLAGRAPSRVPSGRQKPSAPCRWKASCWRPTAPTWHPSRCGAPGATAP